MNKVVRHELDLAPRQGRWMYVSEYTEKGVRVEARRIQTDDGILTWVLSQNGLPLSPSEVESQKEHLASLSADASYLAANRKAMLADNARINELLADLPTSVQFGCPVQKGSLVTIPFQPLPGASSFDIQKRILSGMSGTLQIDVMQMRLLSAVGSEQEDVSLLLGVAQVLKGSSISLRRAQIVPGIWEATQVSTHIAGHFLFLKSISQNADEVRLDYRQVPSGLSARDALRYLEKPEAQ